MSDPLGHLSGELLSKFAVSITPIYATFFLGFGFCFIDILKLDFTPAVSVIIQYVCLPTLLFLRIATNKSSELDLRLLGADALSKLVPLVILLIWWRLNISKLGKVQGLEWVVTIWMLATLPNTVLIGDQILLPMFSSEVATIIKQENTSIIFAQSLYWYNCIILLFEIREMFIEEELALNPPQPIDAGPMAPVGDLEKQHSMEQMDRPADWDWPRPSPAPSSGWEQPAWEQARMSLDAARPSWEFGRPSWSKAPVNPEFYDYSIGSYTPNSMTPRSVYTPSRIMTPGPFMTPGRMTPGMTPNYRFTPSQLFGTDREYSQQNITPGPGYLDQSHSIGRSAMSTPAKQLDHEDSGIPKGSDDKPVVGVNLIHPTPVLPSTWKRIGRMTLKVIQRMLQVPLLYGSVLGFIWSINQWRVPALLKQTAILCASPTVGLAMILIGMVCFKFYKGAKGFVPCGWRLLVFGFFLRFAFGPLVMWVCSLAFGIRGYRLDYAIIQVIVPQGAMAFALAQIYGCKLEVITPAIYIQMIVFIPFILAYLALLGAFAPHYH